MCKYCSFLWSTRLKLLLKINCIWVQGMFLLSQDCKTPLQTEVKKEGSRSQSSCTLAPRYIHTLQTPAGPSALSTLFPTLCRYHIRLEHARICRLSCQHSPWSRARQLDLAVKIRQGHLSSCINYGYTGSSQVLWASAVSMLGSMGSLCLTPELVTALSGLSLSQKGEDPVQNTKLSPQSPAWCQLGQCLLCSVISYTEAPSLAFWVVCCLYSSSHPSLI